LGATGVKAVRKYVGENERLSKTLVHSCLAHGIIMKIVDLKIFDPNMSHVLCEVDLNPISDESTFPRQLAQTKKSNTKRKKSYPLERLSIIVFNMLRRLSLQKTQNI